MQLTELDKLLKLTQRKILVKDSIIDNLNKKVFNLQTINLKKDQQFNLQKKLSDDLHKELKAEKRKAGLFKIGTGIGLIAIAVFLL